MAAVNVHFPLTVRICGEPSEADLTLLAAAVQRAVGERIGAAERELGRRGPGGPARVLAPPRVVGEAARAEGEQPGLIGRYLVPSYDSGGAQVGLPVARPGAATPPPADDPSEALRRIHELMHPGFFHGLVAPSEAVRALRLLQNLSPLGRLDALSRMRLSGDLTLLGRYLPVAERPALDALLQASDPAVGVIVVGDLLRVRLVSGRAVAEHEVEVAVDGSGAVRLPMLDKPIRLAGLLPAQAANAIAQAYFDGDIYRILTVILTPLRRGSAYGGVSVKSAVEARSTVTARLAVREDARLAQFRGYVSALEPADAEAAEALARYYEQLRGDLSRWASPAELWTWALRQSHRPALTLPVQPYLDLARSKQAEAAKEPLEERLRILRAVSRYLDWVSHHAADPKLGTTAAGYGVGEVYARYYVAAVKEDVERKAAQSVALERIARAEALEHSRWEQLGPVLDAALEFLKRRVWRPPDPEIAEDRQNLTGWLILPSAAEMQVREVIGRQYLDDILSLPASGAAIPSPDKIGEHFNRWLRGKPDLLKAYLLTSSHPYVERYDIKLDIPAWQTATEVIIGFIPIVGQIVGGAEALSGEDLFGHRLSATDRTIIGVTLLLPALGKLYKGGRALMAADELVRAYGLSSREAAYTYRMARGLGPGSHAAGLFSKAAEDIRGGRQVAPEVMTELEQSLKELGMTDREAARAFSQRPRALRGVDPAVEAEVERAFAEVPGGQSGLFQTTQRLIRGNLGERLAADALAHDGHVIISYKPSIMGTNQGGIDIVTFRNGTVYLIDNKALTRAGNISSVSALTTNLTQNIAGVRAELTTLLADAARSQPERVILRDALSALDQGRYVKAVTNANVARDTQILSGVTANLSNQGIQFINVFP